MILVNHQIWIETHSKSNESSYEDL